MKTENNLQRNILLWKTAIALQAVNSCETSDELMEIAKQNLEEKISADEAVAKAEKIKDEHSENLIAARMFAILSQDEFSLAQEYLSKIHATLYEGILENAGEYRKKDIAKKEWALDGAALQYPDAKTVPSFLNRTLNNEAEFNFDGLEAEVITKHIAEFISQLWQIHPFEKFNTQTIAIFFIKYLRKFGFENLNETLVKNPVYFRNSLARAVYNDESKKIKADISFLERLIENLLFEGTNELDYKATHISKHGGSQKKKPAAKPKAEKPTKPKAEKKPSTVKSEKKNEEEKISATKKASTPKPKKESKPKAEKKPSVKKAAEDKTPYVPTNPKVATICQNAKIECNEKMEKILAFLLENKSATNSQAREIAEASTETARKILVELAEKDIVKVEGANRNRVYWLK